MTELVSIVPNNKFQHSQSLPGIYYEDGMAKILYSPNRFGLYPMDDRKSKDKNPDPYDLKFQHTTGKMNYLFECDFSTGKNIDPLYLANAKLIKEFYEKHPQCIVNGERHKKTTSPEFDVVYLKVKEETAATEWGDNLKNAMFIQQQTIQKLCDIMVYFGDVPEGKSETEIKLALVGADYKGGIIYKGKNIEDFKRTFMEEANIQYDVIIAIRKAIAFKIISTPIESGKKVYRYSDSVLGMNENDCIVWFQSNPTLYESLVRAVQAKSFNIKLNDKPDENTETSPFKKKTVVTTRSAE